MRRPPIPGLVLADGWLAPYEREIQARLRLYDSRVAQLTRRYGSPEECARGYTRMGFNRNEQEDVDIPAMWINCYPGAIFGGPIIPQ